LKQTFIKGTAKQQTRVDLTSEIDSPEATRIPVNFIEKKREVVGDI
jgi:hypothetical protein